MASTRKKPGQLGAQVEDYRAWLTGRGYTSQTVRNMLADLGRVGRWMSGEGLAAAQLDEDAMAAFLAAWQAAGHRRALGPRAMVPLMSYLREAGVTPAAEPPQSPLEALVMEYRIWLVRKRGLAAATVLQYESTARCFLQQAMAGGVLNPAGADVSAFLLRECGRISAGSARGGSLSSARCLVSFTCTASRGCGWGRPCRRSAAGGITGSRLRSVPLMSWTGRLHKCRCSRCREFQPKFLPTRHLGGVG